MNTYQNLSRRALCIAGCALASLSISDAAHAAGVLAGTLIENTATATYKSGAATASVTSNKVTVKVDELLDVAVTTLSTAPAVAGSGPAVLVYSVTNSGNGPEAFDLAADPQVAGNAFDGTITQLALDTNDNGIYEAGIDTVLGAGAATPALAPDRSIKVFVLVTAPAGATDAQTSQVRLTALAATGTGTPGNSFSGQGEGGGDAVVGLTSASANSLASLIASLAAVTLTKTAAITDQFNTAKPVPGATVNQAILVQDAQSVSCHPINTGDHPQPQTNRDQPCDCESGPHAFALPTLRFGRIGPVVHSHSDVLLICHQACSHGAPNYCGERA